MLKRVLWGCVLWCVSTSLFGFQRVHIRTRMKLCSTQTGLSLPSSAEVLVKVNPAEVIPFVGSVQLAPIWSEPLAVAYLDQELGLPDATVKKIILKYPWILYLRVNTNLRPTVEVLQSYGFKRKDIHSIVSRAPSILAIDHTQTLPHKLSSIQSMFHLTNTNLVRLVVAQPYLLTSSVARNEGTANFLKKTLHITGKQLQSLLMKEPKLAMTSVDLLLRCWGVLTKLYGFTPDLARELVLKHPVLLSLRLVKNVHERLGLLSSELDIPSFPSPYVQALVKRFPQLLYVDVERFLEPNIHTLKSALCNGHDTGSAGEGAGAVSLSISTCSTSDVDSSVAVDRQQLQLLTLLMVFPQLLGYNHAHLQRMCADALHMLTGADSARHSADSVQITLHDGAGDGHEPHGGRGYAHFHTAVLQQLDLLGSFRDGQVRRHPHLELQACTRIASSCTTVTLDALRALHIVRTVPWILAYRPERSQRVLCALAVTLSLTREELTHCVRLYPRLFSLSVEGKLQDVLRVLARAAEHVASITPASVASGARGMQSTEAPSTHDQVQDLESYLALRRAEPIRRMVRELVLRYPPILGTSLARIEERFASAEAVGAAWSAYLTHLRRSPAKHAELLAKAASRINSTGVGAATTAIPGLTREAAEGVAAVTTPRLCEQKARTTIDRSQIASTPAADVDEAQLPQLLSHTYRASSSHRGVRLHSLLKRRCLLQQGKNVTFTAFPDAVHVRQLFSNERHQTAARAKKALNKLLPYRWLLPD